MGRGQVCNHVRNLAGPTTAGVVGSFGENGLRQIHVECCLPTDLVEPQWS